MSNFVQRVPTDYRNMSFGTVVVLAEKVDLVSSLQRECLALDNELEKVDLLSLRSAIVMLFVSQTKTFSEVRHNLGHRHELVFPDLLSQDLGSS